MGKAPQLPQVDAKGLVDKLNSAFARKPIRARLLVLLLGFIASAVLSFGLHVTAHVPWTAIGQTGLYVVGMGGIFVLAGLAGRDSDQSAFTAVGLVLIGLGGVLAGVAEFFEAGPDNAKDSLLAGGTFGVLALVLLLIALLMDRKRAGQSDQPAEVKVGPAWNAGPTAALEVPQDEPGSVKGTGKTFAVVVLLILVGRSLRRRRSAPAGQRGSPRTARNGIHGSWRRFGSRS